MRATSAFSFEVGMSTRAWRALAALRMRVNKSEMGSVCIVVYFAFLRAVRRGGPALLPTGFHDAGNFPAQRVAAETDAAHLKFTQIPARPAAQAAAVAYANLELQLLAHLGELRVSRHGFSSKSSSWRTFSLKVVPAPYWGGLEVEPAPASAWGRSG